MEWRKVHNMPARCILFSLFSFSRRENRESERFWNVHKVTGKGRTIVQTPVCQMVTVSPPFPAHASIKMVCNTLLLNFLCCFLKSHQPFISDGVLRSGKSRFMLGLHKNPVVTQTPVKEPWEPQHGTSLLPGSSDMVHPPGRWGTGMPGLVTSQSPS